jgi:hypothetical protein
LVKAAQVTCLDDSQVRKSSHEHLAVFASGHHFVCVGWSPK